MLLLNFLHIPLFVQMICKENTPMPRVMSYTNISYVNFKMYVMYKRSI